MTEVPAFWLRTGRRNGTGGFVDSRRLCNGGEFACGYAKSANCKSGIVDITNGGVIALRLPIARFLRPCPANVPVVKCESRSEK